LLGGHVLRSLFESKIYGRLNVNKFQVDPFFAAGRGVADNTGCLQQSVTGEVIGVSISGRLTREDPDPGARVDTGQYPFYFAGFTADTNALFLFNKDIRKVTAPGGG
jgi:hypothetical protein